MLLACCRRLSRIKPISARHYRTKIASRIRRDRHLRCPRFLGWLLGVCGNRTSAESNLGCDFAHVLAWSSVNDRHDWYRWTAAFSVGAGDFDSCGPARYGESIVTATDRTLSAVAIGRQCVLANSCLPR